ncbi:hypothetical protein L1D41_27265 [Vibrio harveyi]|uniref:hypothetical protein n=1 Tax=Vibrio harveyi TaxID=669 RepID=UPI001EFC7F6B|nr:hypothetical protein [Vibrio harveyi]MCG9613325.1 hypothetical protein [Vibrio harveyi]MCG9671881.1 hypothetical protein [Vibrio harveyi]
MLYEKPRKKRKEIILDTIFYGAIMVIVFVYFLYGFVSITEIVGDSAKVTDVINSVAQIATACAFLLAFHQYQKNSIKDRQTQVATEAKSLTAKMARLSDELEVGDKTNINAINLFIAKMTNLGTDFNALYDDLDDDIYKAMVRMHWQDMYFNHLSFALKGLDVVAMLKSENIGGTEFGYSLVRAKEMVEEDKVIECFHDYAYVKNVMTLNSIPSSLIDKLSCLHAFKTYYLDDASLNDILYGVLSRIDIRAAAPLLAVVDEMKTVR